MNNKQRILLLIGGILLIVALITTPQYQIIDGNKFVANTFPDFVNQFDLNNAILRTAIIFAIFVPVFFILKNKDWV